LTTHQTYSLHVQPSTHGFSHLATRGTLKQSVGITDRAVHAWIADGVGRSSVKNALAIVGRVGDQAIRDGLIASNPFRITGWQSEYAKAEAELEDPRKLALPDYAALKKLSDALVANSADSRYKDRRTYRGWGDVVEFMACTAARIGEVSGVRVMDIDLDTWIWTLVRQTTPSPGGLQDKRPKSKRARYVPILPEIRPMVQRRVEQALASGGNMARLFTGPRGGRVTTAVLRDATDWDNVVTTLGYEFLRRHDLRHTGLTWMADAGVPLHVLREIAGHGDLSTTQRYLHANHKKIHSAGHALQNYLVGPWSQTGPKDPSGSPHP
jgi:integrase